jgi:hypothetical protein
MIAAVTLHWKTDIGLAGMATIASVSASKAVALQWRTSGWGACEFGWDRMASLLHRTRSLSSVDRIYKIGLCGKRVQVLQCNGHNDMRIVRERRQDGAG